MRMKMMVLASALFVLSAASAQAAPPLASEVSKKADLVDANGWIEMDASAFEHNIKFVQSKLTGNAKVCAVMKADAYGHGIALLMPSILKLGIDCVGVTSNDEIRLVREKGFKGRLMRIRLGTPDEIKAALPYDAEEFVGNLEQAEGASKMVAGRKSPLRIHLALNSSGMSREGVDLSTEAGKKDAITIAKMPNLTLAGIMTHYPMSDKEGILKALTTFKEESAWVIKEAGLDRSRLILHTANTQATLEVPETHLDYVRPGRAIYGDNGPEGDLKKVIFAFKSKVTAVNAYPAGRGVSYDGTHVLKRDSKLANIPVGWSDDYRRSFSNKGQVLIRGQKAPIVGVVSMNAFMVDVTDIPNVKPGDEVVILGKQGAEQITQEDLEKVHGEFMATMYAIWAHTMYKVLKE